MAAAPVFRFSFQFVLCSRFSHVSHVLHDLPVVLSGLDKETG